MNEASAGRPEKEPTPAFRLIRFATRPAAVACALALAAMAVSLAVASGIHGVLGAALAVLMIWIAMVDARRFIIPNELTVAALALGLLHAALLEPSGMLQAIGIALLRGVGLALLFLAIRELYRRLRGREGLGLGDVKLAGVAGAWLGWSALPIAIEIAALGALGYYGVLHFWLGRRIRATSRVPFGLFLAPAIWIGWLLEALLVGS